SRFRRGALSAHSRDNLPLSYPHCAPGASQRDLRTVGPLGPKQLVEVLVQLRMMTLARRVRAHCAYEKLFATALGVEMDDTPTPMDVKSEAHWPSDPGH